MLLALGLLMLVALWWLGRSGRPLASLPFGLSPRRVAAGAAIAIAALLAARGAVVAGLAPLALALWLLFGPERIGEVLGRASKPAPIRTASIELDRKGREGTVLVGPHAGQRLSLVPVPDLVGLERLCREADPAGARLLQLYLDRRSPGWRVDAQRNADAGTGRATRPGTMTEEEAYQILGLERGATLEQVRAAHRALMLRLHPDQGGSAERAARVNAARDRLTHRHR